MWDPNITLSHLPEPMILSWDETRINTEDSENIRAIPNLSLIRSNP